MAREERNVDLNFFKNIISLLNQPASQIANWWNNQFDYQSSLKMLHKTIQIGTYSNLQVTKNHFS